MNKAQLHCFLFMCFYITLYSDKSRQIFLAKVAKWLIFQQINEYAGKNISYLQREVMNSPLDNVLL